MLLPYPRIDVRQLFLRCSRSICKRTPRGKAVNETHALTLYKRLKARSAPSSRAASADGFVLNPFKPVTSFQQPKEVTKKDRSLQKFLTAKNGLFLGSNWNL
jgi:hypothetical protein